MLSETFVAATEDPVKPTNRSATGVHLHELQPGPKLKNTFKKSSSKSHCLAVGDNHIFAAQADKAVVHVYNRESNKQEAVVPFPDKICSISLAFQNSGAGTLVLGTETGRIILWEVGGQDCLFPSSTIIIVIHRPAKHWSTILHAKTSFTIRFMSCC